jgi:hypothetical protein
MRSKADIWACRESFDPPAVNIAKAVSMSRIFSRIAM